MSYKVNVVIPDCHYEIIGASYVGEPRSNTVMYISKKIEPMIENLSKVRESLIFAENGISIPERIKKDNYLICTDNPQREYAEFVSKLFKSRLEKERKRKYKLKDGGYYIGENVSIGRNSYIEPGCLIGHDVVIGEDACILAGTIIKNSIIGDSLLANEYAVIGAYGFTIAEDKDGNKFRIPTLGRVKIGNSVEVGVHDNISCGSCGDTLIDDYVKLDALVHIGHDAHLHDNVEITAGGIIGGFVDVGENSYAGINVCVRNRISVGEHCVIGMGSTVTKAILPGVTVIGNPAKIYERKEK